MGALAVNKEQLAKLQQELGIRFVVLYGSHADGSAHDESDVDVAVYLEPNRLELFDFSAYASILNGLVSALNTGRIGKLDLVILNTANILLRYEITSKGKLLFGDELAYIQYCAFASRDYIDAKSLFELESHLISKRQLFIHHHATR